MDHCVAMKLPVDSRDVPQSSVVSVLCISGEEVLSSVETGIKEAVKDAASSQVQRPSRTKGTNRALHHCVHYRGSVELITVHDWIGMQESGQLLI